MHLMILQIYNGMKKLRPFPLDIANFLRSIWYLISGLALLWFRHESNHDQNQVFTWIQIFCHWQNTWIQVKTLFKQGKSEGFESCDRPIVRKRPIWVNKANLRDLIAATGLAISNWIQIVNFSARVTVKFDGWPCKTIGQLFYATSSFVHHFVPIGEFKLKLQSGNTQSGSNWMIFRAVRPWNLTDDLAIK